VEVYPAAALRIWGFNADRYKRAENREARLALLKAIIAKTAHWLNVSDTVQALCEAIDDALDALVAALVARASAFGWCEDIPPEHRALALREGWIALPRTDSLGALADGISPRS
jgi:predicted RNase H-like nuclease